MEGSNQFVSIPAKLKVEATDSNADCTSNDANCSAFKVAGEDFNFNVSAACADGTITPNFQMNDITLSVNDIAPNIGNSVPLGITSIDISDADNGSHDESTQSISEVGVFSITATPSNLYFTETIEAATSESIGRFTPAYYQLGDINNGELSGGNPFVYTGQMETTTSSIGQISYLTPPEFTITAKSISGSTTLNYTGDFIKLTESSIDRDTPTQDATQLGKDSINEVDLSAILNTPNFAEFSPGVLKYQFNNSDHYVYTRNANSLIAPFTTDIDLVINSIIDSDSIQATDNDSDTSNGVLALQPTGLEIRFGRWIIENSYGPETSDIRVPMSTQYWNASYFVTNDEDSFTSFNATDASITDNQLSPATTPSIVGSGLFNNGETSQLTVESAGDNIRGSVTVEHDVPSWLKYDWSVIDESYDENPSAIATFGLYRGNDRIIYRQEVFN
jgi:MSHA biogenesis protein MshQ